MPGSSTRRDATDFDLAPVSGWLRLGSLEWLFDAGRIWTYSYYDQVRAIPSSPMDCS